MQQTFSLTSVVVTHEMESVRLIADRVCMLDKGRVIGVGTLDELKKIDHPFIEQFFERRPDEDGGDSTDYHQSLTGNSE
jgi:phospholipid/cholesterol/gamma-HCH transport system ATP-binding protein